MRVLFVDFKNNSELFLIYPDYILTSWLIIILSCSWTARVWPLAFSKCQYMPTGFKIRFGAYTWLYIILLHWHHIQLSYLFMDNGNKRGKSSSKNCPSLMTCDNLMPVFLVVSSVFTSSWTIHVFLGSFYAQCGPELWLSLPPRVWSVATSFSCSCLEPGVSLRVCLCVCTTCACNCLPTRESSPPAWLVRGGTENVPSAGPSKALVSDWPVFWGHFFPGDRLLWPASLMEENTGLWEMF